MVKETTVFRFSRSVPMREVESTLKLARLAASSLHGDRQVSGKAKVRTDRGAGTCEIDTTHDAGLALAVIFAGFIRREFGGGLVSVEQTTSLRPSSRRSNRKAEPSVA